MNKRYAATAITGPDFVKLAQAHSIPAKRITDPENVSSAIEFARNTPGPVLLDFMVEKEESVFPMVPTGASLDEMIRRPIRYSPEAVELEK